MKDYIKLFLKHCPEFVRAMNLSDHNYSGEYPNSWHIEGTIFCHTQMVCLMAERLNVNDLIKVAALLHDVGKPLSESIDHENRKHRYIGHEGLSVFLGLSCIKKMGLTFSHEDLSHLVNLISHHTSLFKLFESKDPIKKCIDKFKGNKKLLNDLIWLSKCDALGRFTDNKNETAENLETILKPALDAVSDNPEVQSKPLTATILCGPPLSGKTQWIKNNASSDDTIILCRDDLVMSMGGKKSYSENWHSLDQDAVEKEFQKKKLEAINSRKNIIFDLTNCSSKARRSCLSSLSPKLYHKKAVVLYTDYQEVLCRNLLRAEKEDKYIHPSVIEKLMKCFTSPLYDEVDEIQNIFT